MLPEGGGSGRRLRLGPGAVLLGGLVAHRGAALLAELRDMVRAAPFRHMETPGGRRMSVAMSNCGPLGWTSDRTGYRYSALDPVTGRQWPPIPSVLRELAAEAAALAGFQTFEPDACLVNRYAPGARLSLHQDRNERSAEHPIVSVSLGLPAIFLWGGPRRGDPVRRVPLLHGDVVVWGGGSRLMHHGVAPLPDGEHPVAGRFRYNLTLRRAA